MSVDPELAGWLDVLPELTFYELLRVDPRAGFDEIHRAFLAFAGYFHPDTQAGRTADERVIVERIFRRANEAFRILSSPPLRQRYDELLAQGALQAGPPPDSVGALALVPGRTSSSAGMPAVRLTPPPGSVRSSSFPPEIDEGAASRAGPRSARIEDQVRVSGARPFVLRAAQLLKSGDAKQARIQLTMAMHMDAGNPALEALMVEVEAKVAASSGKK
jgi:curved DNA-binding protein CbpA